MANYLQNEIHYNLLNITISVFELETKYGFWKIIRTNTLLFHKVLFNIGIF